MMYLDPKSDIAFKKLFGSAAHTHILMSFLNSVLEREEGEKIIDIVINDPNNVPETPLSKASIVDVRCTDQAKNQYIVEMQVIHQKDYAARAQYYSALALARQLADGEKYDKLVPVIFVGVLDFTLFKTQKYLSHHFILDNETYEHEFKHFEFHFIELPKFKKDLHELEHDLDKWMYLLIHAGGLEKIPESLDPVLNEAFGVLARGNWSRRELEAYDRYLDAIRSSKSQLETAIEIGIEKGIAQGIAQGIEKGIEKGRTENKLEIAKKLLERGMDSAVVSQITGLTEEEIKKLASSQR